MTSNNTTWQILPGLSQTITVPTGFVADVEVWAQGGSFSVRIGGDCAPEVNCGELK